MRKKEAVCFPGVQRTARLFVSMQTPHNVRLAAVCISTNKNIDIWTQSWDVNHSSTRCIHRNSLGVIAVGCSALEPSICLQAVPSFNIIISLRKIQLSSSGSRHPSSHRPPSTRPSPPKSYVGVNSGLLRRLAGRRRGHNALQPPSPAHCRSAPLHAKSADHLDAAATLTNASLQRREEIGNDVEGTLATEEAAARDRADMADAFHALGLLARMVDQPGARDSSFSITVRERMTHVLQAFAEEVHLRSMDIFALSDGYGEMGSSL